MTHFVAVLKIIQLRYEVGELAGIGSADDKKKAYKSQDGKDNCNNSSHKFNQLLCLN